MTTATSRYDATIRSAASQGGVVSRAQLISIGWTDSTIRNSIAGHRWNRLLPGVYNTVTGEPGLTAWWWAAHLYAGDDSRLSGRSALAAWGAERAALPVHIAIPARRRLPDAPVELVIHRQEAPRPARCPRGCPPAITLAHAVLDVIRDTCDERAVIDLVTKVCQKQPSTLRSLESALRMRQRVRHRKLIVSLLAEVRDGATTALEIPRVRRILRAHGLPAGRGQVREMQHGAVVVRDRVIDQYGIVIEFDGRLGHDDPSGRLRDHRRDNSVAMSGRVALRFGWADVHQEPCAAAAQVAWILRTRGWSGHVTPCGPACRAPSGAPGG